MVSCNFIRSFLLVLSFDQSIIFTPSVNRIMVNAVGRKKEVSPYTSREHDFFSVLKSLNGVAANV